MPASLRENAGLDLSTSPDYRAHHVLLVTTAASTPVRLRTPFKPSSDERSAVDRLKVALAETYDGTTSTFDSRGGTLTISSNRNTNLA